MDYSVDYLIRKLRQADAVVFGSKGDGTYEDEYSHMADQAADCIEKLQSRVDELEKFIFSLRTTHTIYLIPREGETVKHERIER